MRSDSCGRGPPPMVRSVGVRSVALEIRNCRLRGVPSACCGFLSFLPRKAGDPAIQRSSELSAAGGCGQLLEVLKSESMSALGGSRRPWSCRCLGVFGVLGLGSPSQAVGPRHRGELQTPITNNTSAITLLSLQVRARTRWHTAYSLALSPCDFVCVDVLY